MQLVHEASLLVAAGPPVLRIVVEHLSHQGRGAADHPGGHRHPVVGIERRRLAGDLLGGHPLRFHEFPGGGIVAGDAGVAADRAIPDHLRVVLGLGIADADALLDQGVVFLGQLFDLLLAPLELAREPEPLAADRPAAFCGQVAVGLFP